MLSPLLSPWHLSFSPEVLLLRRAGLAPAAESRAWLGEPAVAAQALTESRAQLLRFPVSGAAGNCPAQTWVHYSSLRSERDGFFPAGSAWVWKGLGLSRTFFCSGDISCTYKPMQSFCSSSQPWPQGARAPRDAGAEPRAISLQVQLDTLPGMSLMAGKALSSARMSDAVLSQSSLMASQPLRDRESGGKERAAAGDGTGRWGAARHREPSSVGVSADSGPG